jgi:hypothetical protein
MMQPNREEESSCLQGCLMKREPKKSKREKSKFVTVNDRIQKGYRYQLSEPMGRNFNPEFRPELTSQQMLALDVFCGKYMTDARQEFPKIWFKHAKLSPSGRDCSFNYFGVDASQPLSEWRNKGWINSDDPRGWFQWYCRYYMGRRMPEEDRRQIKRWKAFRRHIAQVRMNCEPGVPAPPTDVRCCVTHNPLSVAGAFYNSLVSN